MRRLTPTVFSVSLASLASLVWLIAAPFERPARAATPAELEGYLVLPFANDSSVKALDWMASALAVTVAENLESLPQLRPVYGASVLEGWPAKFDEAKAAERAHDAGAKWVIGGTFSRPNWRAGVGVTLYQVVEAAATAQRGAGWSLQSVASASVVGERNALLDALDQALDQMLTKQGWMPAEADVRGALHHHPTKDIYAFTLYGRALNLFYGLAIAPNDEQAEKLLTRTSFIDPKFAEARRMLGVIQLARGEAGKAAGQYAYALELKPGYYAALVGLARLYRAENKKQPARELVEKALALRPYDAEMRLLLGTLEFENGELDAARVDLLKVTAARPRSLQARRTLSQVYAARGDIEDLAAELERVAEITPDDVEVRLDLAAAYMRVGKHERAIAAYQEVLKRQPKHLQALKFTGDLYRRLGDPERAIGAYERVRHLVPEDPRAYFLLGAAYAEAGKDNKAINVLEEAQQFKSYVGEAWTNLGAIHLRHGEIDKAAWYLSRAVARAPMRPKAHFNYALLLDATKQRDRALAELKTATELDPEDPESHYLAGVILLRMGRLDDAKSEFGEAVRLKPTHADARHNLALLEDLDRRYGAEHAGIGAQ